MGLINSIFGFLRFNNRNWRAVLLCILAATVFWFFNALNKSYSANINFPLSIEYDEENYVPVSPLPHSVRINVSGLGWDLFRRSLGLKVPPLRIPLENPSEVKKIVGATLPGYLSSQLEGLQINYVLTDTIHLQIDQRATREVAIAVRQVEAYIESGYMVTSEVQVQPPSVKLEGPQGVLRALPDTLSIQLPSRNVNKSFTDDIEIQLPGEQVAASPSVVRISFSVDREVVIKDTVVLHLINIPKDVRSMIIVEEVTCTYVLPSGMVNAMSPDAMVAEIDLAGIGKGRRRFVPKLMGLPAYGRLIRIDTVDVNF